MKKLIILIIIVSIIFTGYFSIQNQRNDYISSFKSMPFQDKDKGCGDVFVYKINNNDTEGISVFADRDILQLSVEEKEFSVGESSDLKVEILGGKNVSFLYYTDLVSLNRHTLIKLIGKSGKAIISISPTNQAKPEWDRRYKATVVLKNIHFVDEIGRDTDVIIDELIFKDVTVGWSPG